MDLMDNFGENFVLKKLVLILIFFKKKKKTFI